MAAAMTFQEFLEDGERWRRLEGVALQHPGDHGRVHDFVWIPEHDSFEEANGGMSPGYITFNESKQRWVHSSVHSSGQSIAGTSSALPLGQWQGQEEGTSKVASLPEWRERQEGEGFTMSLSFACKAIEAYIFHLRMPLQLFALPAVAGGFVVEAVNLGGDTVGNVSVQATSTWKFFTSKIVEEASMYKFLCDGEDLTGTPDHVELQHTALSRVFGRAEDGRQGDAPTETPLADEKTALEDAIARYIVSHTAIVIEDARSYAQLFAKCGCDSVSKLPLALESFDEEIGDHVPKVIHRWRLKAMLEGWGTMPGG